ncbi:MAG: FecR domain-containing protein [Gemmatimonadota bacterium]|nr:FecR domain-containing protein [Gemmatimonadota bacterium]
MTESELPDDFPPQLAVRLVAYFRRELTTPERTELERWVTAAPEREALVARLMADWQAVPLRQSGVYDVEAALVRAKRRSASARVEAPTRRSLDLRRIPAFKQTASRRAGYIALAVGCIAVLAMAGSVVLRYARHDATHVVQASQWREYTTGRGQLAEISLNDGTSIWLGPATRLRVSQAYGTTGRAVTLDGQALFTVMHDARLPFSVRTPRTVVEDLGTKFVVSDYRGDRTAQVAVESGIVALRKSQPESAGDTSSSPPLGASITATGGDLAQIDSAGVMTLRSGVDVSQYVSWTRGTLTFDHTPLRDAIGALNRWYDADVRLGDPALGSERITATLNTESFRQALQVIQTVLDVHVDRREKTVTLTRNQLRR